MSSSPANFSSFHRISFFLFTCLISGYYVQAQEVQWGQEYKKAKRLSNVSQVLGEVDGYTYAVMSTATEEANTVESSQTAKQRDLSLKKSLLRFDSRMRLLKDQPIDMRYNRQRLFFEFAQMLNGRLFVFGSYLDRRNRKNVLMAQEADPKTLLLKGRPKEVAEASIRNARNIGSFAFQLSRNKSTLLLIGFEPGKKGQREKFNLSVFDENMEELWAKQISIPFEDQLFRIQRFVVDNRGDVYVLGVNYIDRVRDKRQGRPNYSYVVLAYRYRGLEFEQYDIKLKDKFITDLSLTVNEAGDLICAGFYSERGTFSIKGTYFLSIDAITSNIKEEGYKEFDRDFLIEFMPERAAAKGRELYEYDIDEIILRADGGALLIAEQYYVREFNYTRPDGTFQTQYEYNYHDIIVVNINPDKSIAWAARVPKNQITIDDGGYFSSFSHAITNQYIYIVFNDHPRNLDGRNNRLAPFAAQRGSVVVLAAIDIDGNVEKELLSSNREEGILTRPKSCQQVNRDLFVVYGSKGKTYKMGRIDLN